MTEQENQNAEAEEIAAEASSETTVDPTTTEEQAAEASPEATVDSTTTEEQVAEASPETTVESTTTEEASTDIDVAVMEEEEESSQATESHDIFNWSAGNKEIVDYTESEISDMTEMYDATFKVINEDEIVEGTIMALTDADAVINIGYKSDGLVNLSEFRDMPDLKAGDVVDVYVKEKEDERGQLSLSRKNAKLMRAWEQIVDAHNTDKIVKGTVISKTKGGLIANVFGLETFLPGSQIDVKPILDYDAFVGKTMEFKVVKVNEAINNAVVSHKALIESDLEEQRQEIIAGLDKGQVLEGTIKNITDFGAFIDLGGLDGLLYITDISWGRINHPSEVLELNQKVNVVVLDFDDAKKRISLGMKQLTPHPWEKFVAEIEVDSTVKGKIVNIEDYGAFLEIEPGVEGLIHVSEVSWSNQPVHSRDFFNIGDEHDAKVVTIDKEARKMSLSLKQLKENPWDKIEEQYGLGSKHSGLVQNLTPYGVFIELEEGIGGMVHISDLSWTKRYGHPSEVTKVGENMEVVVLEIDKENHKLSLGHKQLEEDPWDTFENVFPVGSVHQGTVIKRDDKGAIVALPYGLEGFAPGRHLVKEDGTTVGEDETLDFKIIEFDRNDKRIILSHSRIAEDEKAGVKRKEAKGKDAERRETRKSMDSLKADAGAATFSELDVLSELKAKMMTSEQDAAKAKLDAVEATKSTASEEEEE